MITRIKSYDQLPKRTLPVAVVATSARRPLAIDIIAKLRIASAGHIRLTVSKLMGQQRRFRRRAVRAALVLLAIAIGATPLFINTTDPAGAVSNPALSLTGYIWENEDGSSPDTVTQLAGGNGTITAPWGGRLNLRAQLKNTGDALNNTNVGLFYDKGDGLWNRVSNSTPKQNNSSLPIISTIDGTNTRGMYTQIAIDNNNTPWISYHNTTDNSLMVAKYVGSGGTGCSSSTLWTCETVQTAVGTGSYAKIGFNKQNRPVVAARHGSNLIVAERVGSGGTGCNISSWTCTTVKTAGMGEYASLAFDSSGNPWVAYRRATNTTLDVARFVGSGGSGCDVASWTCTSVDDTGDVGNDPSILFDKNGTAWVSYRDAGNQDLRIARYVGSSGNCTSTQWNCGAIDSTGDVGEYTSMAISHSGVPWVSYYHKANMDLEVAQYVGSGGTGCDVGITEWTCTLVEDTGNAGSYSSIAFDASGNPWISFRDASGKLMVAKYVASAGFNCTSSAWTCLEVDLNNGNVGNYTSIAFDTYGTAWISYYDGYNSDLKVAQLKGFGSNTNCANTVASTFWDCYTIEGSGVGSGRSTSLAIDPSGVPWIAYWRSGAPVDLKVAKYVGTGGTGCDVPSWQCTTIHSAGSSGRSPSIAFTKSGQPWISFHDGGANNDLYVARFVGSGGSGCATAAWDCDGVDIAATADSETALGIDPSGTAWVAYNDSVAGQLKIANYVGSGGSGCNDAAWTCVSVDDGNVNGFNVSITMDLNGNPWVSYNSSGIVPDQQLFVARYVGSGGTGCLTAAWQCDLVYDVHSMTNTSIRVSPSGQMWIAWRGADRLRVAKYVGSGGTGCTSAEWSCQTIYGDGGAAFGTSASLAFDPSGNPLITFQEASGTQSLYLARYVGGTVENCYTGAVGWDCSKIVQGVTSGGTTADASIGVDPNGDIWISYFDSINVDLKLARLSRSGDITLAGAGQYQNGASISESHADMTSATDTVNRDDADCIGGGTWNNGRYYTSASGSGISLPAGNVTAQCTEVVFSIDLSQAEPGAAYRFAIATDDYWTQSNAIWRGLSGGGQIPQLQVVNTSMLAAKDSSRQMPNCSGDSSWGCEAIDNLSGDARDPSLAFSPDGTPWISYYDNASSDLYLAQYVGTGGTGCASSAWTCTAIDTANSVGTFNTSLAFGPDGTPWISYYYATGADLRVAKYVGSGGTGCATTAWTCTDIKNTGTSTGSYSSLAIDAKGRPFISYRTSNTLEVAEYVGSGGSGCTSTAWKCTVVSNTAGSARSTALAISPSGDPWVVHLIGDTGGDIVVARYVGAGGSGCTSTQWTCTTIANTDTTSASTQSIAFDTEGDARVSYRTNTGTANLFMAEFVGSGGSGCTSTAWTCTTVDDDATNTYGLSSSLAFSSSGKAMISYRVDTGGQDLKVARFVGSGGSGCSNAAWQCSTIDTTNNTGSSSSLAFDLSGNAWVAYIDNTNTQLMVAKTHRPFDALNTNQLYKNPGRNAQHSAARYPLTLGGATASLNGQCNSGTADYLGLCALFHANGDYDTVTTLANESPYLTFTSVQSTNSELPTGQWSGTSSLAPNTAGAAGNIVLQVYRYGSTNAWETIATDSTSANCTARCNIEGQASGTASEYFESVSGKYRVHFRLYQEASTGSGITFKTDQFKSATNEQRTRHGGYMLDGIKRPLNWR